MPGVSVSDPSLIRIADHCDRLHRLNHLERWDDGDKEFDRICMDVFGFTTGEIPAEAVEGLLSDVRSQSDAFGRARNAGFDLTLNGYAPVADWEDFYVLILAKTRGLVPDDPLERTRIRLENEVRDFRENG